MQNFELIKVIGQGSYSLVYEVRRKLDNKIYALKKVKLSCLSQQEKLNCLNEIRLLARLSHPNIIQYKQAFFEVDHLCLITECADHGDFLQLLVNRRKKKNPLSEEQFCIYAREMANGLNGLHKTNILHRDVKAANFFIVGDKVKIGDMNVSSISKDGMASTKIGTPYYTSPQIWKEQPYSFKSDIWALGCLFYEMVTYLHPFTGRDVSQLKQNVLKHEFAPISLAVPAEIVEIITSCLKKDPRERPTSQQLLKNQYLKRKYNEHRQKTMQKSLLNEKQHKQTCFRILREITSGSCQIKKALLPKSNYLSIEKCETKQNSFRQDSSKPKKKNTSLSKKLTSRLLTMYNIYHQKPPMALRKGTKAIQIR